MEGTRRLSRGMKEYFRRVCRGCQYRWRNFVTKKPFHVCWVDIYWIPLRLPTSGAKCAMALGGCVLVHGTLTRSFPSCYDASGEVISSDRHFQSTWRTDESDHWWSKFKILLFRFDIPNFQSRRGWSFRTTSKVLKICMTCVKYLYLFLRLWSC